MMKFGSVKALMHRNIW